MKLVIRDFQAIAKASLEIKGITFLTGLNNQGKSSIIRALHAAIAGRMGEDHVRHGASKAMVGVELEEGPDHQKTQLAWIKGKKGAEYFINKDPFTKLGRRGVPIEDLVDHGFREIEFMGGRHHLTFDLQDDPHFLVALPPTQVFDYVSKVLQEREILPVIKVMNEDAKALDQEAKLLEGQIQTRKGSITDWSEQQAALQPALQRTDEFICLRKDLVQLRRMGEIQEELAGLLDQNQQLDMGIQNLEDFIERTSPKVEAFDQEVVALGRMGLFRGQLSRVEEELEEVEKQLSSVKTRLSNFPDLDRAEKMVRSLQAERDLWKRMLHTRDSLVVAESNLEGVDRDITDAEEALFQAEEGFEKIKKEIGICPVCGSEIGGCDE